MVSLLFYSLKWIVVIPGIITTLISARRTQAAPICRGNAIAYDAVKSTPNFTVQFSPDVGYGFYHVNPNLSLIIGGPNVSRGLIIVPADGVAPLSYAPYARSVAQQGYYVAIVKKATPGNVLEVMIQHSELVFWAIAGHGTGASLAARIAIAVQPRVKSLILIAGPLPPELDLRSTNLFVTVVYGAEDTISTPSAVEASFSRLRGDALITKVPGLGYYDFAYSTCVGNIPAPAGGNSSALTPNITASLLMDISLSVWFLQWFPTTPRGLSFGDNHFLTPGFNDSKPYPGDIRVRFDQVDVPGSNPKRYWWVFTPTVINGGIVYFSGAAVEGKAYFPMAFEIAARGHLVVIPEVAARYAKLSLTDAISIIDSDRPIFSGVPKGSWAIAGHSLGAAVGPLYAGCYGDKIYGAVMHAGEWNNNINMSEVPILLIYGTVDNTLKGTRAKNFTTISAGLYNPNTTTIQVVEGGNHYQIGDYGYQFPDQIATISLDAQHDMYANITVTYLDSLPKRSYPPTLFGQTCMNGFG